MRSKLFFTAIISILVVLSLTTLVSAAGAGVANPNPVSLQITIDSLENDSIVTEDMLSDVTVSEKEYWLVNSGDNQLEIDEPIGPYSQGVVDFIDQDDLSVLTDEIFVVNGGKYKYEQFLHFDKPAIEVTYDENNDLFLKVTGNEIFTRYELNFLTAPKSAITDSQENPNPDGEYLPDFQNAKLTLLGKEYTILHATKPAGNASIQLVLMAGHKSDLLLEGESKTFTFDNKEYAVHLISVDGNNIEFEVNGELLEIQSDTVYGLSDETPISANIFWAGEEPVITLFFNAEKIVLQDDNIGVGDKISTHKLMINDEIIDKAEVVIAGWIGSDVIEIDSIQIKMIAGEDYFVLEDGKLSNAIEAAGDQKEVLMNGLFDIEYDGLNEEGLPLVYVTGITEETEKGLPLQVSTNKEVICFYSLGEGYQEMEVTGGTSHSQYLFGLLKGQDYEVSVQCVEEEETNTVQVSFHVAGDVTAPQITIKFPQQDSIITEGMLSDITTVSTEAWKVENGDDLLEFGEPIGNVSPVIGDNELTALADNNWMIKETEYDYNQSLSFPVGTTYYGKKNGVVNYEEDDDDITSYFLRFYDNFPIATYNLAFTSPAQSGIDDKILTDFQETTLNLFGKEYYVFSAERPSQNSVKLTLMNDFVSDFIGKDETKTFSLSGVGYEIIPTFMNEEYVQFKINGETTSMLKIGKMYLLTNGITLAVEDIQEDKAKFILGTEILELQDTDITDNISSDEAKVNSELIDGTPVKIKGTDDNSVLSVFSLEVKMTAQDDYFIASGENLLDQPELEEKDSIFTKNWDIKFDGFISNDTQYPQVYITAITNTGTKSALPLELSTDENAICSYSRGEEYQEMEVTGKKFHSQNLFDLEEGKDYEVSIQCVDESDNTNTDILKFHFGKVAEPAEETPPQNSTPSNSGGGGGSSSTSKKTDNSKNKEIKPVKETSNLPEMKKASEPVQLLADSPMEASNPPSFSNKLTAAVVGIREKGGLVYVAGFVLIIASLFGIKLFYSNKKN